MSLESRVVKLELRTPDARPIWDSIILDGENATPEEQAKIDSFKAMGHSVVIYQII